MQQTCKSGIITTLGFAEKIQTDNEYVYDGNGRAVVDKNKGILSIKYNLLDLPDSVFFDNGNWVHYKYEAGGTKLSKHAKIGTQVYHTFYVNGLEYTSVNAGASSLQLIHAAGSRIRPNGASYDYQYDITDDRGNSLVTLSQTLSTGAVSVVQVNSYYAYGNAAPYNEGNFVSGTKNHYLYNGKELQDETGWYDYHARMYDADIGRWMVVDPMSESFYGLSPYNYVLNNPLNYTDPTGMYPNGKDRGQNIIDLISAKDIFEYDRQNAPGTEAWYYQQMYNSAGFFEQMSESFALSLRNNSLSKSQIKWKMAQQVEALQSGLGALAIFNNSFNVTRYKVGITVGDGPMEYSYKYRLTKGGGGSLAGQQQKGDVGILTVPLSGFSGIPKTLTRGGAIGAAATAGWMAGKTMSDNIVPISIAISETLIWLGMDPASLYHPDVMPAKYLTSKGGKQNIWDDEISHLSADAWARWKREHSDQGQRIKKEDKRRGNSNQQKRQSRGY